MPASEFKECAEFGLSLSDLSIYFAVPKAQVCARFDDLGIDFDSIQRRVK